MAKSIDAAQIEKTVSENEEKLRQYVSLLIKANELARLTGPTDCDTLWNSHIIDCAYALPLLPDRGCVIDVGTGGGLPGIVWAICRKDIRITLLDSISRKCAQVKKIAELLGLANVSVECCRSEDYAKKNGARFDAAAARAVCSAGVLAEYLSPLVKVKGRLIAFKGPRIKEELDAVPDSWNRLGLSSPEIVSYRLSDMERYFVLWNKEAPTPKGYPRRPGMAEKFPWYTAGKK